RLFQPNRQLASARCTSATPTAQQARATQQQLSRCQPCRKLFRCLAAGCTSTTNHCCPAALSNLFVRSSSHANQKQQQAACDDAFMAGDEDNTRRYSRPSQDSNERLQYN